jgi:hypothetical protein
MTAAIADALPGAEHRAAQCRYGVVSLIILALLVFEIAAPDADWARALSVVLTVGALAVAIATSRAPGPVRRRRASVAGGVALVVAVGTATGLLSPAITFAVLTLTVIGSTLSLFPLLGRTPPPWRRPVDVVATSLGAHAIDVVTVAAVDGPLGRVER